MSEMYDAILALCRSRGMNVTQLCRTLGIPRSTLSELAAGRTRQLTLRHAARIADYFGVPVDDLCAGAPAVSAAAAAGVPGPGDAADPCNEPIAAYESLKRYLTPDDKADIATLIRLRAEINRGRRP